MALYIDEFKILTDFINLQIFINLKDFINRISHRNNKSQGCHKSHWEQNQVPQSSESQNTRNVHIFNTVSNKKGFRWVLSGLLHELRLVAQVVPTAEFHELCTLLLIVEMTLY